MGYWISRLTRSLRMGMMGGHEDTGYTSKRLQTYVDHYPFLGVLPEEAGETADINALYAARFGLPANGSLSEPSSRSTAGRTARRPSALASPLRSSMV